MSNLLFLNFEVNLSFSLWRPGITYTKDQQQTLLHNQRDRDQHRCQVLPPELTDYDIRRILQSFQPWKIPATLNALRQNRVHNLELTRSDLCTLAYGSIDDAVIILSYNSKTFPQRHQCVSPLRIRPASIQQWHGQMCTKWTMGPVLSARSDDV